MQLSGLTKKQRAKALQLERMHAAALRAAADRRSERGEQDAERREQDAKHSTSNR